MNIQTIHLVMLIFSIIFMLISTNSLILAFIKNNFLSFLGKINQWIILILYTLTLYNYPSYLKLFTKYTTFFDYLGVILCCYGYYGDALNSLNNYKTTEISSIICFILGLLCFIVSSLFNKNTSLNNNNIFSFYDSLCYLIGAIMFLMYSVNNKFIYKLGGLLLFLIGRWISIYIAYINYIKVQN